MLNSWYKPLEPTPLPTGRPPPYFVSKNPASYLPGDKKAQNKNGGRNTKLIKPHQTKQHKQK